MRLRRHEQRPPHAKACNGIVGLCLREQALRFRHFGHARQPVLITRARLTLDIRAKDPIGGNFRSGNRTYPLRCNSYSLWLLSDSPSYHADFQILQTKFLSFPFPII